jgi:glycine cleavage system pyridoxal-binding protein P
MAVRHLPKSSNVGTVWVPVRNSLEVLAEVQGETIIVSVDLDVDHANLLDAQSAVENAVVAHSQELAKKNKERIVQPKVKWSRKEMASTFLRAQCRDLAERLREQIRACGELPDAKDEKAVATYAAKVFDFRSKSIR